MQKICCGLSTALEVRDQSGHLLRQPKCAVLRRAAVDGQILLLLLDDLAEHHALAALVEDHAVGLTRALKDAGLQPARRKHVDQERTVKVQPCHDLDLRLQRVLRWHEQHAALSLPGKRADARDGLPEQPVRSGGDDLHGGLSPRNVSRETTPAAATGTANVSRETRK